MNIPPTQQMTYHGTDPFSALALEDLEVPSLPSEVNYVECLLVQNGMDVKFDNISDLANQCLWVDQADDRASVPQSNTPFDQNEANTPDLAVHPTGVNLAATPVNLSRTLCHPIPS